MATINGDDNDNVLNGTTGNDTINGNGGNDTIDAGAGNDIVDGGDGNDTIIGGSGSDTINGGAGDDYIDLLDSTTSAPDTVDAGSGNDTVRAWFGNDTIDGGDGTDLIDYSSIGQATPVDIDLAAGTADIIGATFGTQTVTNFEDATGTFGDDTIAGTDGANVLSGHNGDDILDGRGGDDTLDGGTGNDTIDGGAGNDSITGGDGDDTLTGGDGDDTFLLSDGHDVITDFNTGNTGAIDDGDQSNNDFVDLSGYYSQANYDAAVLAGHIDPLVIKNPLQWLQADQADDGILNDTFAGWDANTTLTLQNGGVPVAGSNLTFDNTNVVCFTKGAMILTPNGEVPVEHLKVGDFVVTMDNGLKPIRWIGCRELNACELQTMPNLRPVLIPAGQLGNKRDLLVSRQHGMVLDTPTGGGGQQLVRACHLAEAQGPIRIANGKKSVCYYHIMFDQHEIIFAEGAPSESFYPGPMGLRALGHSAFCELAQIFPEMRQVLTQCRAPELAYGERARAFAKRKAVLSVAMH